jgi:hypothetical protein
MFAYQSSAADMRGEKEAFNASDAKHSDLGGLSVRLSLMKA